ncbi:MAG: NAD(P)H-dependent oxidoreductase [Spirochaetia bacterium]|nr:NAD(P)H-dependent oxidoreductase [Spirochaetia bacterium]
MARKVLLLFAHPALEKSRVNRRLAASVRHLPGVTFRDLYEEYPDFQIDIAREQKILLEHDAYIFQHPFYWYSSPALVKEWIDLVLEHGFAYGQSGRALEGKIMMNAITTGGPDEAYKKNGYNRFTIREFLAPFDQTARLCQMRYLAPFAVHRSLLLDEGTEIVFYIDQYKRLIEGLVNESLDLEAASRAEKVNELL